VCADSGLEFVDDLRGQIEILDALGSIKQVVVQANQIGAPARSIECGSSPRATFGACERAGPRGGYGLALHDENR
jgi:hypothetical protein